MLRDREGQLNLAKPIEFNSAEYVCWHEAGHVETALRLNATVGKVEIYHDSNRSWGKTSVVATPEQSKHITLGGFSVEFLLFRSGLMLTEKGIPPIEKEFINFAFDNARLDFEKFKSTMPKDFRELDDAEQERKFMSYAIGNSEHMDFSLVERIAAALCETDKLTQTELEELLS